MRTPAREPRPSGRGACHATEAYVGDVSKPLKMLLPDYQRVEQRVWEAVAAWAGLPTVLPKTVKHADMVALFWEWRDLLATPPTEWMDERYAVHVPALGAGPDVCRRS